MRIQCLVRLSILSVMCAGFWVGAFAAELTRTPLVVTATRDEAEAFDLPLSVHSIDLEADSISGISRSIPESLRYTPAIMVQKTGHGQGSPYIRGFTSQRTLFLIDGIRLNNSVFRDGPNQYWNTVDGYSIGRIEIVKGPGSVLYGSDALGGTVNVFSRDIQSDGWLRHMNLRYSDAENSTIGRVDVSGYLNEALAVSLGGTHKEFGDLEGGSDVGTQAKTGYDESAWDAKLVSFLANDATLTFAHFGLSQDDAWRTHKTIYGISWEGTTVGNEQARIFDQDRRLTYLQYNAPVMTGFADRMKTSVSWHEQDEERFRTKSSGSSDRQGFDVGTLGVAAEFGKDTSSGDWVWGIDYYHDTVDSFSHKLNADGSIRKSGVQGPVADDATYGTLGAYLQDGYDVTDELALVVGLRYTRSEADAKSVQDPVNGGSMSVADEWDNVSGSVRLRYYVNEAHTVQTFAGVSQGFRAPNLSDLTRLDSARSNETETPAPDLDPEYVVSYEVGAKFLHDQGSMEIAYYYTDIDGMIVRTPTGLVIDGENEVTKKNGGDGFVQGVELTARWTPYEDWEVWGVASWLDGEGETYPTSDPVAVVEPLDRLMPATGHVGVRWMRPDGGLWLAAVGSAAAKADQLSTRDQSDTQRIPPGGTPGYAVLSLRGGVRLSDASDLTVSVENVTDEDYRIHGSGLNEAGRNVVVALDVRF